MMFKLSLALLPIVFCLQIASSASANFVIRVGDGVNPLVFNAGGPASIPVFGYAVGPGLDPGRVLTDYNLGFDFGPAGNNVGVGFSNFAADFSTATFGTTGLLFEFDPPNQDNFDFLVGASQPAGVQLQNHSVLNPLKLFDLTFDISNSVASGVYNFAFLPSAESFGSPVSFLDGTSVGALGISANGGTFEVLGAAPVPEPTSLLLVACAGGAAALRFKRRSKRRKNDADSSAIAA